MTYLAQLYFIEKQGLICDLSPFFARGYLIVANHEGTKLATCEIRLFFTKQLGVYTYVRDARYFVDLEALMLESVYCYVRKKLFSFFVIFSYMFESIFSNSENFTFFIV